MSRSDDREPPVDPERSSSHEDAVSEHSADSIEIPLGTAAERGWRADVTSPTGSRQGRIGNYRIRRVLGRGGMGIVYEAEQLDPRRLVAVKVILRDSNVDEVSVRLFRREAETMARLRHPNIASIFEAGRTDEGLHFIAMELVPGEPLTNFIDRTRANRALRGQQIASRLRLFRQICEGVAYAHQRGVIHRDLKPGNIKVWQEPGADSDTEATIKILDFGLARILDAEGAGSVITEVGSVRGTLAYMSPEQARGEVEEVDSRSDVYSLGLILYELLSGELPYSVPRRSLTEAARIISVTSPRPLRLLTQTRSIDRDLETIALKALAKDRELRYESAGALREDVDRFLGAQPILARGPSTMYQLRKLIARNKLPSALVASLFLVLAGFGVWMSALYARSEANLHRALEAETESDHVSGFLVGLFEISDPSEARGNAVTAREVLDAGASRIEHELAGQPAVRASIMHSMGMVYRGLGLYRKADTLLTGALTERLEMGGENSLDVAATMNERARVAMEEGRYDEAESLYERALEIREGLLPPADPLVGSSLSNLGLLYNVRAEPAEAEPLLERAVDVFEVSSPKSLDLAASLNSLALLRETQGRFDEAEELFRRSLQVREEILDPDHPELATGMNNLASLLWRRGKISEAEPLARGALTIWEKVLGQEHPEFAKALVNLGTLYHDQKRYAEAESSYRRALAIEELSLGPRHQEVAVVLNNLGRLYTDWSRPMDAERVLLRSLEIRESVFGADHPKVSNALISLGELLTKQRRYGGAGRYLTRALVIRETAYGPDHQSVAVALHAFGVLSHAEGQLEEAETLLRRALRIREATLGADDPRVDESRKALVIVYRQMGRVDEAVAIEAQAASDRNQGAVHP